MKLTEVGAFQDLINETKNMLFKNIKNAMIIREELKRHVIGEGYPKWAELNYWVMALSQKPGGRRMAKLKYIPGIENKKCRFILEEIPVKEAKRGKV